MLQKLFSPFSRPGGRYVYLTAVGLWITAVAFSQGKSGLNGVYEMLQTYSCAHAQQERLFVFLNSGFYYPGENIAFKAVLFDAEMKIKTDGSRFFYLQLVNGSGTGIGNFTCELHSGECAGTIKLPDTLVTGLYTLRAYTRWMQNYDPANCFRRPVLIISPLGGSMVNTTLCDSLPVKFYPENGRLIAGIENSVLVRMNPCHSDSIRQLRIADDRENNILSCSLDQQGMAVFSFTPQPGRRYHAAAADSGFSVRTFDLPEPQNSGYGMHIEAGRDSLHIRIAAAPATETGENLYLAIMTGDAGKSVVIPVDPVLQNTAISVPIALLPAGITQVALCGTNTVLCSRLWYRKSGRIAVAETDGPDTLETRGSVTIPCPLNPADSRNNILAVSLNEYNRVTDSLVYNEINYFRYFDLYSSLSNPVNLPLFDASASEMEINNSLMVATKCLPMEFAMHNPGKPRYAKEEQDVVLSGKVILPSTLEPVKGATVLLSYPDSVAYMNYSITGETGEFSFMLNERLYNKKVYIIVQGYPKDKNPVTIIPDDPFMITSSSVVAPEPFDHPVAVKVISDHQNIAMAYRVFYAKQAQTPAQGLHKLPSYREDFYGKPDLTLITGEYESLPDIFEIRKNLVPRLKLKVRDNYCLMTIFDEYLQLFFDQEAFVLLNNIPFPSFKNVLELNSDIIRSIEMKSRKFFYDNYLMYGIVSIKTRKPVEVEPHYSYRIASVDVMPEISDIPPVQEVTGRTLPDVRHSLYWRTNRKALAESSGFRFEPSDIKGNYQLKVYSVAPDGKLQVKDKVFTVL